MLFLPSFMGPSDFMVTMQLPLTETINHTSCRGTYLLTNLFSRRTSSDDTRPYNDLQDQSIISSLNQPDDRHQNKVEVPLILERTIQKPEKTEVRVPKLRYNFLTLLFDTPNNDMKQAALHGLTVLAKCILI